MTLRGVLDVVLTDPGIARVVGAAGSATLAVTAPPPNTCQPVVVLPSNSRRQPAVFSAGVSELGA